MTAGRCREDGQRTTTLQNRRRDGQQAVDADVDRQQRRIVTRLLDQRRGFFRFAGPADHELDVAQLALQLRQVFADSRDLLFAHAPGSIRRARAPGEHDTDLHGFGQRRGSGCGGGRLLEGSASGQHQPAQRGGTEKFAAIAVFTHGCSSFRAKISSLVSASPGARQLCTLPAIRLMPMIVPQPPANCNYAKSRLNDCAELCGSPGKSVNCLRRLVSRLHWQSHPRNQ